MTAPWVPPDVRAVFFDAVGTLLFPDPSAPVMYAAVARGHGLAISADEVRTRFVDAFRAEEEVDRAAGWRTSDAREEERWRAVVRASLPDVPDGEACFRKLYAHFALSGAWRVNPDAAAVFRTLSDRGVRLGLASNYDYRLLSVVEGLPALGPLLGSVVVSSHVGVRKPGAAFFDAVERAAGCDRDAILFVGDDVENDYEGATAAGLRAVLLDERGRHAAVGRRITRLSELTAAPLDRPR